MSQRTRLVRAKVAGSIYLGERTQADGSVVPSWSSTPEEVLTWLCDGFRFRFNQRRSTRSRYLTCEDRDGNRVIVEDPDHNPVLLPLGRRVDDLSDKQARQRHSHLAAMPSRVLQATERIERTDWFAAAKRRRTNVARGRRPGAMPGFRSKRDDARFVCWHNGGENAIYRRCGRRSGIVTISGQNPRNHKAPDGTIRWQIHLHVHLSQPIRPYTSIRVNLTRREVVFVNTPLPITGRVRSGEAIGLDRGVVHTVADSNGCFYDAPDTRIISSKIAWHQRRMAKSRLVAERRDRDYRGSKRYQAHKAGAARLARRQARIREDFAHKLSNALVKEHDFIGIEDLRLSSMTKRARGRGAAAKSTLNRLLQNAALTRIASLVDYKASLAGVHLVKVDPAYTSQRCHRCQHTVKENRESQAVFSCRRCAWTGNADYNAAVNILEAALERWARTSAAPPAAGSDADGGPAGSKGETDPRKGPGAPPGGTCDEPRTTRVAA
ncbi:MAG: transposase [Actinomycetota bacterium]|jgi:IS605 OrfB family transposase|nr:transposase [Actinomycetota bacterium]